MFNFIFFIFSLILIYLPNSDQLGKVLPPCNRLINSSKLNNSKSGSLFKEIDEIANKKIEFYKCVGDLKHLKRSGWVMNQIPEPETVAGHMYRMAMLGMMLDEDELKKKYGHQFDLNKVIKMTIVHDLAETITGDYTPYDKISKSEKKELEIKAMNQLSSYLPNKQANLLNNLFDEYEERKSPESIITKEIDRLDLILQAFEYEKSEFKRTGKLPDFEEFFDFTFVLSKIENEQLKEIVSGLMKQRSAFLKSICSDKSTIDEKKEENDELINEI